MPIGVAGKAIRAGGFSPDQIGGLAHWYDATKLSGLSDGGSVGTWPDEAGSDDLTQGTGAAQATYQTGAVNNNPTVRYDGSDDSHTVDFADISEPFTIFVGARRLSNPSSDQVILTGLANACAIFDRDAADAWAISQGSLQTGGTPDGNTHVFSATFLSGSNPDELRIDATQVINADSGNTALDGLTVGSDIGGGGYGNYDMGEILVYNTDLADGNRGSVESYLAGKWGVTLA